MVQRRARLMAGYADVDSYIDALDPGLARLASTLRAIVLAAVPRAAESIKWSHPTYESGGPFCYIKAFSGHVNLGFWRGAALQPELAELRRVTQPAGHGGAVGQASLAEDVMDMVLHGGDRDPEFLRYLVIREATADEHGYLPLAL
jgi:hypothetical protein